MLKPSITHGRWLGHIGAVFVLTFIQSGSAAQVGHVNSLGSLKPTDMIESWKYFPGKEATVIRPIVRETLPSDPSDSTKFIQNREIKPIARDIADINLSANDPILDKEIKPVFGQDFGLIDAKDVTKENIGDSLIRIPQVDDSYLTQLITSKKQPTFVQEKLSKPIINTNVKGGSKVLATYRIMVPIWIPAIKKMPTPVKVRQQESVEYVKERHTEMVPVTKQVTVKKTVIKAEPVPQKVITDFVKKTPFSPTGKDDGVKPREEILDTVVTKFNS